MSLNPNALTGQEAKIYNLLITTALEVKEIAHELHLSYKTVDVHKNNLFRKLNVHSRLDLYRQSIQISHETIRKLNEEKIQLEIDLDNLGMLYYKKKLDGLALRISSLEKDSHPPIDLEPAIRQILAKLRIGA